MGVHRRLRHQRGRTAIRIISTYIALSDKRPARAEALLADEPVELIAQDDLARIVAERAAKEA